MEGKDLSASDLENVSTCSMCPPFLCLPFQSSVWPVPYSPEVFWRYDQLIPIQEYLDYFQQVQSWSSLVNFSFHPGIYIGYQKVVKRAKYYLQQSTTWVTPGIVTDVSAILVAITTFGIGIVHN